MTSRQQSNPKLDLKSTLKEQLAKPIDFDKICLMCGSDTKPPKIHKLNCCKRNFHYECLVKYLQYDQNYPNSTCPYCRQHLRSLPLQKGSKPLKHVHDEFYIKKKKSKSKNNVRKTKPKANPIKANPIKAKPVKAKPTKPKCQAKKKNGSLCSFSSQGESSYCKIHLKIIQNKDKCHGIKKDGSKCIFKSKAGTKYCKFHQIPKISCQATYLSGPKIGTSCIHKTLNKNGYCNYHTPTG